MREGAQRVIKGGNRVNEIGLKALQVPLREKGEETERNRFYRVRLGRLKETLVKEEYNPWPLWVTHLPNLCNKRGEWVLCTTRSSQNKTFTSLRIKTSRCCCFPAYSYCYFHEE